MKTLPLIPVTTPMFLRPMLDGRCLVVGVLPRTPKELTGDAVANITVVVEEYRDAPEMSGLSTSSVLREGWKGVRA